MGEYATYKSESVKIGTCEDMYYLRLGQRAWVQHERGNVNPITDAGNLRFRFPWPDEDRITPGSFDASYKEICIPGAVVSPHAEHGNIQFTARNGYLLSLPCPEATPDDRIHKNGYGGAVKLVAQRFIGGRVLPVLKCGGCGAMWRLEEQADIEELRALIVAQADEEDRQHNLLPEKHRQNTVSGGHWWRMVANRLDKELIVTTGNDIVGKVPAHDA